MGAWPFLDSKLREFAQQLGLSKLEVEYIGRSERASPAVGSVKKHAVEQSEIIKKALSYT
jgi:2-oxoglutarate dehydrogenase E1 component